jgi:hypothetical protein
MAALQATVSRKGGAGRDVPRRYTHGIRSRASWGSAKLKASWG